MHHIGKTLCINTNISYFINKTYKNVFLSQIKIPSDALVGLWRLSVKAASGATWCNEKILHDDAQIYVLFNPWCKGMYVAYNVDANRNIILVGA